ncbi:MAG TPA: CHRD domain-containing protein [Blastocatellia bacterium]|jgi:cbb3-type cytochrome oxidase subunit 3|nr:CHRD domain-containing protein [Blastocatellia bacterium]
MKRTIASVILMALTMFSVASVMMRPVKADIIVFTAQLLASNEVPPITNADRNAFGTATITLDTVANTARFDFSLENAVGSSVIILAHIHEGPPGVIGPVRVDSGLSPANPIPLVNGAATVTRTNLTVPADVRDRILANPSAFYFNVHTNLNPVGVARGQLVRAAAVTPGTNAPTLSEWGLILMTLLFIAVGTFFLAGRGRAASAAGAGASVTFAGPASSVDWKLLAQVALCVEAVIAVGLLALAGGAVDALGALTSGLVISFILHLFIGGARRR